MSTDCLTLESLTNIRQPNRGSEVFLPQLCDLGMLDSWNHRLTDTGSLWNRLPVLPKLIPPSPLPPTRAPVVLASSVSSSYAGGFSPIGEKNESFAESRQDGTWTEVVSPQPCSLVSDENTIAPERRIPSSSSPSSFPLGGTSPASVQLGLICAGGDSGLVSRSPWCHACAGCNQAILQNHCLSLSDGRLWHAHCLVCSHCTKPLHTEPSCYCREGDIYCKEDYQRLFGSYKPTAICAACRQPVTAQDVIMRALRAIYHYSCFACHQCQRILQPGDRYAIRQGRLICHQDWCQSFLNRTGVDPYQSHQVRESPPRPVDQSPDPDSSDMKPDFDAAAAAVATLKESFAFHRSVTDEPAHIQPYSPSAVIDHREVKLGLELPFCASHPIRTDAENTSMDHRLSAPPGEPYSESFSASNTDPADRGGTNTTTGIQSNTGQTGAVPSCSPLTATTQQFELTNHSTKFPLDELGIHASLAQSNRMGNPYLPPNGPMLFGPPAPPSPNDDSFRPTVIPYHPQFSHSPSSLSHLIPNSLAPSALNRLCPTSCVGIPQACDIPNLSYPSFLSSGDSVLLPSTLASSLTNPLNASPQPPTPQLPPLPLIQPHQPGLLKLIDSRPMLFGSTNPGSLLLHQQHQQQKRNRKRRAGLHQAFDNVCLTGPAGYCVGLSQRQKRMRTSFKHHQLRAMKAYFNMNHNPDVKDLKVLTEKTGLSKRVLQVWFQNARAKYRRSLLRQDTANSQNNNSNNNNTSNNPSTNTTSNNNGTQPNGLASSSTGSASDIALLPNSLSDCDSKSPRFDLIETDSQLSPGPDKSRYQSHACNEFLDDSDFATEIHNPSHCMSAPSDESAMGMFCSSSAPHHSPSGSSSVSLGNAFGSQRPLCSPNPTFTLLSPSCHPRDLCSLGSIHG